MCGEYQKRYLTYLPVKVIALRSVKCNPIMKVEKIVWCEARNILVRALVIRPPPSWLIASFLSLLSLALIFPLFKAHFATFVFFSFFFILFYSFSCFLILSVFLLSFLMLTFLLCLSLPPTWLFPPCFIYFFHSSCLWIFLWVFLRVSNSSPGVYSVSVSLLSAVAS